MFGLFLEISTFVRPSGQWMGYNLCRELVVGFWGLGCETNWKWINIYIEAVHLLFLTSVSTVGLSERGLNLGDFTCSRTAIWYVLCRKLVLGFLCLKAETNLKWINIYWSGEPPILDVRLDRRSVGEGSELTCFTCSRTAICYVLCRAFLEQELWYTYWELTRPNNHNEKRTFSRFLLQYSRVCNGL